MNWKNTIIGATLSLSSISVGGVVIDANTFNVAPIQEATRPVAAEAVKVSQVENVVKTEFPWKGEKGITVSYDLGKPTLIEKIADKRNNTVVTDVVDFGDGGFKIDIVLDKKPDTNQFCYSIAGYENYDFFLQPPLTQQEIDEGAVRPDEIVGSYAVYHKTLKNNGYKTGKVMHIPYPYVWEVNDISTKERAENFTFNNGSLCVTVRQGFLDNATYPVRIDPTFGYTSIGATPTVSAVPHATKFTAPEDGTVTSITAYCVLTSGTSNQGKAAYTDSSSLPNTKIAEDSGNSSCTGIPSWVTNNISFSVVNGTTYWLAQWTEVGNNPNYYYDTGSTGQRSFCSTGGCATFETWPTTWTNGGTSDRIVSIYATYTATEGGGGGETGKYIGNGAVIGNGSSI